MLWRIHLFFVMAFCSALERKLHRLPRIYCPRLALPLQSMVQLDDTQQAHYVTTVMRVKPGFQLRVFNGVEGEFLCTLVNAGSKQKSPTLEVISQMRQVHEETQLNCVLFFAPLKAKRLKLLLEKCTELGVSEFQPVITQNTNEELRAADIESLSATIAEAAEQSERQTVPQLRPPISFKEFIAEAVSRSRCSDVLVCLERSSTVPILSALDRVMRQRAPESRRIGIFCGPEGGFSFEEAEAMKDLQCVSLGANILRAETAALFAVSCLSATVAAS